MIEGEYSIVGSYRGSDQLVGSSKSVATALGYFRAATKPGGLPMTGFRIIDPNGVEIDALELSRRAQAENDA